jgi:riboflavin kinase
MTSQPQTPRPLLLGDPSGPSAPYPFRMEGLVIPGFGRGSAELGIPTANLPVSPTATPWLDTLPSGVYFGWASLCLPSHHPDYAPPKTAESSSYSLYPMVMSIGYNPFYKNTVRSAEVHVLKKFSADFYGVTMRLLILGFIREEKDYAGLEALIADINFDCEVAKKSLDRAAWKPKEVGEDGTLDCSWLLRAGGEEGKWVSKEDIKEAKGESKLA